MLLLVIQSERLPQFISHLRFRANSCHLQNKNAQEIVKYEKIVRAHWQNKMQCNGNYEKEIFVHKHCPAN